MADALLLCPEAPYPIVGGGPLRTACMLEYLASRYTLDVITFREPGAPDPRSAFPASRCRDLHVLQLPPHSRSKPARLLRNLQRYRRFVAPLPDRFAGFDLPLHRHYDLAVVEHLWCAPYVGAIRSHAKRVVLNVHNVESVLLARCAETEGIVGRTMMRRFAEASRRMESELLPMFDLALFTSDADRILAGEHDAARKVVWPNTIPWVEQPEHPRLNEIVFSGNMGYHPNVAAVRYFASEIWPQVRTKNPELTWRLLGKNADSLSLPSDSRIRTVLNFSDAVAEIATARAAVVPLLSGSGTRLKIVEAWAAGTPVISTSVGAEGLDAAPEEHLLIADTPAAFTSAIQRVLSDEGLAHRIGSAGRRLYERKYNWPIAWKMLESTGL